MKEDRLTDAHCNKGISRRKFLARAEKLLFSVTVLSLPPLCVYTSELEALELKQLAPEKARILLDVCRILLPHERLLDSVYLAVIRDIEADMQTSKRHRGLVTRAMASLNQNAAGDWFAMDMRKKVELLKSLQGADYFVYLHTRTIESLYRNPEVWKMIGYEGSSIEYGGYLHRGFDDIDWLDKS